MPHLSARAALVPLLVCAATAAASAHHTPHRGPPDLAAARSGPNADGPERAGAVRVAGVVRDEGGAPLAGATVSVRRLARSGEILAAGPLAATTTSDATGRYRVSVPDARVGDVLSLKVRRIGYEERTQSLAVGADSVQGDVVLHADALRLEATVVSAATETRSDRRVRRTGIMSAPPAAPASAAAPLAGAYPTFAPRRVLARSAPRARGSARITRSGIDREQYDRIDENPFLSVSATPRSTFSLDVDRASYANVRRFLREGTAPPPDAVRLEELVNYFPYHDAEPRGDDALAVNTEVAPAPWRPDHQLVRVSLQARRPDVATLPPSNLVFLVDVSGSMMEPEKLPLVKQALGVLVARLRPQDRVALVTYAGNAGLVLPSTSGEHKSQILTAIDRLEAGGSTAGGAGLELAYRVARENARAGVNSRVILATDGDFNVGPSSDAEMERLIEARRADGTYLTVLGFGEGNLQDAKMKKLAKRGNGNYAYVDDLPEAEKVFGQELGGTLVTVANDAKLQIEFNPAAVRSYRLLGYEGRLLRDEDFADDTKDAGDVGAGHAVTAFYEVVPTSAPANDTARSVGALRYGATPAASRHPATAGAASGRELLYVQLRYKRPGEATSRLLTRVAYAPLPASSARAQREPSADFRFAAAVAEWGLLLRGSEHRAQANATHVLAAARGAIGDDPGGHRAEFVSLVERWRAIQHGEIARVPE